MTVSRVRAICLKFPYVTEHMQWGDHLVFKVAGKIFALVSLSVSLEAGPCDLVFKCTPGEFALLVEQEGIIQAPYFARTHWVCVTSPDVLSAAEITRRLRESYDLVFAKLPKGMQVNLAPPAGTSR